jgi:hypothetical protein
MIHIKKTDKVVVAAVHVAGMGNPNNNGKKKKPEKENMIYTYRFVFRCCLMI